MATVYNQCIVFVWSQCDGTNIEQRLWLVPKPRSQTKNVGGAIS